MRRGRRRPAASLAVQWAELAVAVPQVIGHRVARMAIAGPSPSTRDRTEFALMAHEKTAAFAESWQAMSTQTLVAGQAMAMAGWNAWLAAVTGGPAATTTATTSAEIGEALVGVLSHGLAPIHRTATRNARRLSTTRLR